MALEMKIILTSGIQRGNGNEGSKGVAQSRMANGKIQVFMYWK